MKRIVGGLMTALAAGSLLIAGGTVGAVARHPAPKGTAPLVIGEQDGSPTYTENFNPFSPNALAGWEYMYEPLVAIGGLIGNQVPMLAVKPGVWSNGAKTLTFTLRQGVEWSNG